MILRSFEQMKLWIRLFFFSFTIFIFSRNSASNVTLCFNGAIIYAKSPFSPIRFFLSDFEVKYVLG